MPVFAGLKETHVTVSALSSFYLTCYRGVSACAVARTRVRTSRATTPPRQPFSLWKEQPASLPALVPTPWTKKPSREWGGIHASPALRGDYRP